MKIKFILFLFFANIIAAMEIHISVENQELSLINNERVIKTYKISTKQIFFVVNELLKNQNNLSKLIKKNRKIKWSRKYNTIKDINKFYKINIKISKKEFLRKIHATNTSQFKPFIILHGHRFLLG